MNIWVAGLAGAPSSEQMATELRHIGIDSWVFPLSECTLNLNTGIVSWKGLDLSDLDGVTVRKLGDPIDPLTPSRINLLYQLSCRGVKVFSSPRSIELANDRYQMSLNLVQAGIPIPDTLVTESIEEVVRAVRSWRKAVLKPQFTSKGRGMLLLDADTLFKSELDRWQPENRCPFYLQRYIATEWDIGIALLGNEVIGAFRRVAGSDWQTTIRSGGHYEPFTPDSKATQIARTAAEAFGLDYTVVDLVPYENDYLAYEVSAFGGFAGLNSCGINVASLYAHYIVERIEGTNRRIP